MSDLAIPGAGFVPAREHSATASMRGSDLCQALLDHIASKLPEERDALRGLAGLLAFYPEEVHLFITEAMVLLMRNDCPLPEDLGREVSRYLLDGPAASR
jgi:hypothetical protein